MGDRFVHPPRPFDLFLLATFPGSLNPASDQNPLPSISEWKSQVKNVNQKPLHEPLFSLLGGWILRFDRILFFYLSSIGRDVVNWRIFAWSCPG